MNIIHLILGLFLAGIAAYGIGRLKPAAASWLTLAASWAALLILFLGGDTLAGGNAWGLLAFKMTPLGWFFSMTLLFVYSTNTFFNLSVPAAPTRQAAYPMLYLISLASTIGVFSAENWLALFIFWEIVLWSSTFMIGFGKPGRGSIIYFGMSLLGSFMMLFAILVMGTAYQTFEVKGALMAAAQSPGPALLVFLLMLFSAMVKLGITPFHIWMPEAYHEAPDHFAPVLAGGLSKLGAFTALMVTSFLPASTLMAQPWQVRGLPLLTYILLTVSAVSIVIGTLMAIKQEDAKKLLAYSSVANSGYIMIGMLMGTPMSVSGALVHLLAHALATTVTFMVMAAVARQTGTTRMDELGGLLHRMPITFLAFLTAILSLVGLPPMLGFVSKWLILQSLASQGLFLVAAAAIFGSIGSLLYAFRILSTVFLGQLKPKHRQVREAPAVLLIPLLLLSGVTLVLGIYPYGLVQYTAKIENSLGFADTVQITGLSIQGNNGNLNALLIMGAFAIGFLIALGIFLKAPKSRKVDLMDTYTGGEFIYSPELYSYSTNFFAPLERVYAGLPEISRLYEALANRVRDLGTLVQYLFFSPLPSRTALLISVVTILLIWGEAI